MTNHNGDGSELPGVPEVDGAGTIPSREQLQTDFDEMLDQLAELGVLVATPGFDALVYTGLAQSVASKSRENKKKCELRLNAFLRGELTESVTDPGEIERQIATLKKAIEFYGQWENLGSSGL